TGFVSMFELFSHAGGVNAMLAMNCRAEEVHRLGYGAGGNTVGMPATFINLDLHLLDPGQNLHARCLVVWEGANSTFYWTGGYMGDGMYSGIGESFCITADNAVLDSVFISIANRFNPFVGTGPDLNTPVTLRDCRVRDNTAVIIYGETPRRLSLPARVSEHATPSRRARGTAIYEYIPFKAANYVNVTTMSAIAFTATTLTFDNSNPNSFCVGDVIYWQMNAIGKSANAIATHGAVVTAINSNTITCDLMFPRSYYDETWTGWGGGTAIALRMWAPGVALTGDTNSNTTLSNVSPTTILQNGDWITAAAGIPANTRVRSGGGTATITLSRAATDTATGKSLYWDQLQTASSLVGSATYDPGSLIDGAGATTTVTVTGAALGDFAEASFSLDLQGITLTAWVSAADTVSVRFQNETTGTLDLASGTLRARVRKA
ncbi:MAG: hypothetical protein KKH61_19265, partial [Gammaproteobacteria bacterium]|nr:hypothetical protein [Gammaproteobacteria bacterium]